MLPLEAVGRVLPCPFSLLELLGVPWLVAAPLNLRLLLTWPSSLCVSVFSLLIRTLLRMDLGNRSNLMWPRLNLITSRSHSQVPPFRTRSCVLRGSIPPTVDGCSLCHELIGMEIPPYKSENHEMIKVSLRSK